MDILLWSLLFLGFRHQQTPVPNGTALEGVINFHGYVNMPPKGPVYIFSIRALDQNQEPGEIRYDVRISKADLEASVGREVADLAMKDEAYYALNNWFAHKRVRAVVNGIHLTDDAVPNLYTGETSRISLQNQTSSQEAKDISNKFWQAVVLSCDSDSYYFATSNTNIRRFSYYECKHMSEPQLDGREYSPRSLSEAERLNGTDPLPVEYEGRSRVTFQTCRRFVPGFGGYDSAGRFHVSWGAWFDTPQNEQLTLRKVKGKWTSDARLGDERVIQMKCSDLKEIEKQLP